MEREDLNMNNKKMMPKSTVYCAQGHGYDPEENKVCPYCYGEDANKELDLTLGVEEYDDDEDLVPTESGWGVSGTWDDDDDERTVAAFMKEAGIDPVVGWLVAVNGQNKGNDYRIHSDNNYIGRNSNMDICIRGDETISKENHASIAFHTRSGKFFFIPGNSRNIVHINGNAVFTTTELAPHDIIELGMTSFVFVPFCGEKFDWVKQLSQETEGE